MIRKFIYVLVFALYAQVNALNAGTTGSEELTGNSKDTASECFEGFSRAMFKLNHGLDKVIFEPVAKGYRALPVPIRKATGNVTDNLRSLLTFSNNVLQGDFHRAGNTAGRFAVNTTVGILGIFDPATKLGLEDHGKEDEHTGGGVVQIFPRRICHISQLLPELALRRTSRLCLLW